MATIPMGSLTVCPPGEVKLQELYDRGEHYGLLNNVLPLLAEDPGNVEAAFFAFRSYVAIGLIGPALEMLEEGGTPLTSLPEFAGLRHQLAAIPSGRIPWPSLQERFENNLSCLYRAHPELRRHDGSFRAVPRSFELYRALDGNLQLSEKISGGARRWVPDLADAKRLAASVKPAHDPKQLFCTPYIIVGDRFGALFGRIFDATRKMFLTFTPRVYLLEFDIRAFGAMLWAVESVSDLCNERVSILVGPGCIEGLVELLRQEPHRAAPDYILRSPSSDQAAHDRLLDAIRSLVAEREEAARETITAMQSHYDALPGDHWRKRFDPAGRDRLRILGLTSRFTTVLQYSMRDLRAAFEQNGHEFHLQIEESDHDLVPPIRTAEVIEDFKPDLVFTIDHLRQEYEQVIPKNVPFVCWIQDHLPHLVREDAGRSQGPLDFFISPEVDPLVRKFGYPASQGLAWTMATDDRTYSNEPLPEEALAAYRCDFSFVSNQSQVPRDFHLQRRETLGSDPGIGCLTDFLFDALCEQIATDPNAACGSSATLINRAKREIGIIPSTLQAEDALARVYLHPLTDLLFRQNTLQWVADYCDRTGRTLHLYGNGWESHPRFAKYARGVAKNGPELRAIYQASKINLQITYYGAIHQRLLDGLAAGGFFLIRYCPADAMGGVLQGLLDAVDMHGLRPDTNYRREDVPELAEVLTALADLYHEERPGPIICLPAWKLEYYRSFAAGNFRRVAGSVFDRYRDVAFASNEQLEQFAARYLDDGPQRKTIAASMHDTVVQRFTYASLVKDLLGFIGDRLNIM